MNQSISMRKSLKLSQNSIWCLHWAVCDSKCEYWFLLCTLDCVCGHSVCVWFYFFRRLALESLNSFFESIRSTTRKHSNTILSHSKCIYLFYLYRMIGSKWRYVRCIFMNYWKTLCVENTHIFIECWRMKINWFQKQTYRQTHVRTHRAHTHKCHGHSDSIKSFTSNVWITKNIRIKSNTKQHDISVLPHRPKHFFK